MLHAVEYDRTVDIVRQSDKPFCPEQVGSGTHPQGIEKESKPERTHRTIDYNAMASDVLAVAVRRRVAWLRARRGQNLFSPQPGAHVLPLAPQIIRPPGKEHRTDVRPVVVTVEKIGARIYRCQEAARLPFPRHPLTRLEKVSLSDDNAVGECQLLARFLVTIEGILPVCDVEQRRDLRQRVRAAACMIARAGGGAQPAAY